MESGEELVALFEQCKVISFRFSFFVYLFVSFHLFSLLLLDVQSSLSLCEYEPEKNRCGAQT